MPIQSKEDILLFGLSSCQDMTKNISKKTKIKLGEYKFKKFKDGEFFFDVETSVRNKTVFVIQSTQPPVNDMIMELLLFIETLRRSSAGEINIVIPYYGYARQDRRVFGRQPISSKLIANLITNAGANRVMTIDIHSEQIVGFFDIPVDNLRASGLLAKEIKKLNIKDLTIVSPDHGGVSRARQLAQLFDAPLGVIDKRRPKANQAESMFVLGDVKDRNIVIFDDLIDTGGTVASAIKILKKEGAKDVYLAVSHALLSGSDENPNSAIENLQKAGLKKIITTNSINSNRGPNDFIKRIDLSPILAEVIDIYIKNESITNFFIKKYSTQL